MNAFDVIQKWSDQPFAYGSDCCQFAGEMVEAIHGWNPMRSFSYSDEAEAQAIIDRHGNLEAAMTATIGEPIPVTDAVDGDAVVVDQTDGTQIAGVVYRGLIAVRTRKGVTDWPLGVARRAWSCRKQ